MNPSIEEVRPGSLTTSTPPAQTETAYDPDDVKLIPLAQLRPNPYQPRSQDYREDLDELVASIQQHGILQPVLARQIGTDQYELIAGERRCSAARRAGMGYVPALIKQLSDLESAEVALIENLQRKDLSPVETALAFRALMNDFGLTQQEIGGRFGLSQPMISHLLNLLRLPEGILQSLARDEIQEGHARALLRVEDPELQKQFHAEIVANRLSVRKAEQRVGNRQQETKTASPSVPQTASAAVAPTALQAPRDTAIRELLSALNEIGWQQLLMDHFSSRVTIRRSYTQGGYVEIGFYDEAALKTLVERLLTTPI